MTRKAFLVVLVLIIYNRDASEILTRSTWFPASHFFDFLCNLQKTHEIPMDFDLFGFHKNSPQEISFYFCSTYKLF